LTAEDARAKNNYALRKACERGHLAIVRWLVDRFGLTAEDARAKNNYALRKARLNDHLAVVLWLVVEFY
jgi:hypothetical protein